MKKPLNNNFLLILISTLFSLPSPLVEAQSANAPWIGDTFEGAPCKGGGQGYGPYDYTNRRNLKDNLNLVESAHFTPNIEQLIGGRSSSYGPLPDIDYTLRAFPNHHRALYSAIRVRLNKAPSKLPRQATFTPAECWLQRAVNFSPNDGVSHMLYGLLLHRSNRLNEALTKYRKAEEISPANANLRYNIGLLLVELKQYEEAKRYASNLYKRKYPLPGLKNKLIAAGYPLDLESKSPD